MGVGRELRRVRADLNQEQLVLELELPISRESWSHYENNRTDIPSDICNMVIEKRPDPWLVMQVIKEYTGMGPSKPNGPKALLHPSAVKEIALRELNEGISNLLKIDFARPLDNLDSWELQEVEGLVQELIDVEKWVKILKAVVSDDTKINLRKAYEQNDAKWVARGIVAGEVTN
ncbi:helix-turn-helix domain-containing protein [Jeotgalibacillus campisalis]|uniref:Uncharacterized protein n=1 Tax=Jeotgalibacillus campisalis TaxID=220754 RepID=A0A0C2VP13_9BACL|nr:helix-turn-helix domain-containing protein [Jeotgalibacillus campisalis]KIL46191.1 hypothetical protein KR50_28660 [Jeotgalibacillus campisalis]